MRTIIVVPGARYLTSSNHHIRGAISRLYMLLNVVPRTSGGEEGWMRPLREQGFEVIRFQWSGDVSLSSVRRAAADLSSLIRGYDSVTLVSCCLGSQIATLSDAPDRISRLISLCGVYGNTAVTFPIIDIRSSDDRFGNLYHSLLNAFRRQSIATKTVFLDGIRHDEFGLDTVVPTGVFRNRSLSEIISEHLA